MTPTERAAALGAAVFLSAIVLALAMRLQPVAAASPMRPVDHPRCFPPGTVIAPDDFTLCPDTLPEMIRT